MDEDQLLFDADATRIAQVVLNLLTNAAKFTPAGGHVWVTAKSQVDRVAVTVRDTGAGIAPEDQDKVFGMFGQLNRDMRRSQSSLPCAWPALQTATVPPCISVICLTSVRPMPSPVDHLAARRRRGSGVIRRTRRPARKRRSVSWSLMTVTTAPTA